jgi:hypothetical protein
MAVILQPAGALALVLSAAASFGAVLILVGARAGDASLAAAAPCVARPLPPRGPEVSVGPPRSLPPPALKVPAGDEAPAPAWRLWRGDVPEPPAADPPPAAADPPPAAADPPPAAAHEAGDEPRTQQGSNLRPTT